MKLKDYKFSDESNYIDKDSLYNDDSIVINNGWQSAKFTKKDIIEIAKHFNITNDDLMD